MTAGSDAYVTPPNGPTQWPYTTPSGHTYERPRTLNDVAQRHTDAAQGWIEHWDAAEMPPDPEWEFLGPLWAEIDRLRAENATLREALG